MPLQSTQNAPRRRSDVKVEQTEVSFTWESADNFVALVKDPDSVWDAILGAVKETASDDGTVTFSKLVLLAVGRA